MAAPVPIVLKAAEFYAIELAQLADGKFSLRMTAITVDDEDPQLLSQEIVSERVSSLDEAVALIRTGVERTLGP